MQQAYFYKIFDAWTPPLYYLPRWYEANAYPTLFDAVSVPATSGFTTSLTYYSPTGLSLPTNWIPVTSTPSTTGSILQKVFEVFTWNKSQLDLPLISLRLARSGYFDEADLNYAWFVKANKKVETVKVLLSDGSKVTIQAATDLDDLFNSGDYRWFQEDQSIIISGLDLQQQSTEARVGDWQFITGVSKWASGSVVYFEHPVTKNNIAIHPSQIREDGFLKFNSPSTSYLKSRFPNAARALSAVTVYLDDQADTAELIDLWTTIDEKGLWFNFSRKSYEHNYIYASSLENLAWFGGQTYSKTKNALSAKLRTGIRTSLESTASSFTLASGYTGYSLRNQLSFGYRSEDLNATTSLSYLSNVASGQYGQLFINQTPATFTTSGSIVLPDTNVNSFYDQAYIDWKINYWTQSGSTVTFTDNFDPKEELIVFCPKKVNVIEASDTLLRDSFKKHAPGLKWKSYVIETFTLDVSTTKGLATFE